MSARATVDLDHLVLLKAEARGFSFLPRQPAASLLAGRHASRLRGRGITFEELRAYRPGDDIRAIDWKATARLRSTQVRVYTEERERPVLLVADQRSPMFFGSRRAMKSVSAAEVAALAAWRALQAGDRIGALVFNESGISEFRPHRSETRVLAILHELVRMNRRLADALPAGDVTLNQALEAALRIAHHDHLVILISDLDGADERTEELATRIAAHNDIIVVAVFDPLGAVLTPRPGMVAATPGGRVRLPADPGFPPAFRRAFQRLLDRWTGIFRSLRVPVLPVSTASSAAGQLRDLFGRTTRP